MFCQLKTTALCGCREKRTGDLHAGSAVAKLLTLQGVQSIAVNTLPAPATESVECCLQLMQSLGQCQSVGEAVHSARGGFNSGLVVYGLTSHQAAVK